jgi:enamine deaminase RidA (YjgF/YER057c/UK114 family)
MVGSDPVLTGRVGDTVSEQQGYEAARLSVLNALAALHAEVGLDRISHIVKLTGWVSSADTFYYQHRVVDGASDLLIALFGESGLHARCALGVNVLPFNIPVEIELTAAFF